MRRVKIFTALIMVAIIAGGGAVVAADKVSPERLDLYANFHSIGVYAYYKGDDNGNGEGALDYRIAREAKWEKGHPLYDIGKKRLVGTVVCCQPATEYEIKVTLSDPDGVEGGPLIGRIKTRSEVFPTGSGKDYYVSTRGDDKNPGTKNRPFRTIQKAHDVSQPGDVIWVLPGIYRQGVKIIRAGRADAYIAYRARGKGVIIDGAAPAFEKIDKVDDWKPLGDGVYICEIDFSTGYVACDGKRLYNYGSREDRDGPGLERLPKLPVGPPGGWYLAAKAGKLYVKLADESDPDKHIMQIAQIEYAFLLENTHHIIIDGFEMRFFGSRHRSGVGVHIVDSSNNVVQNSLIHNVRHGVAVRRKSHQNTVQDCEVFNTSITSWPWKTTKGHDTEGYGIGGSAGRGNVYRRNIIHGTFDAIGPSSWGDLDNEALNPEMDLYDNVLYDIADDCFEPEGAHINLRIWNNTMYDCLMGVSLAPIRLGPAWVFRNTIRNYRSSSYKLGVDSFGRVYIYHNTAITKRPKANGLGMSEPWSNLVFRNNIICGTVYSVEDTAAKRGPVSFDYDCLYTTDPGRFVKLHDVRYTSLEAFRKIRQELHGINAEPKVVDYERGDLGLHADSPCVDRGVIIPNFNDEFKGRAPDIGAFEVR